MATINKQKLYLFNNGVSKHISGVHYMYLNGYIRYVRQNKKKRVKVLRKKRYIQKFSFDIVKFRRIPALYEAHLLNELKNNKL